MFTNIALVLASILLMYYINWFLLPFYNIIHAQPNDIGLCPLWAKYACTLEIVCKLFSSICKCEFSFNFICGGFIRKHTKLLDS